MKINQVAKDIKVISLKRFVEIYEKIKLYTVEKFVVRKGLHPRKGTKFDRYV